MRIAVIVLMLFLPMPLFALDIVNEASALPAFVYDGEYYFSPNGFESGLRISGSESFDWSLALLTVFTASQGPGLGCDLGFRYALLEEPSFSIDLNVSLSAALVYHVLGSGIESGYGLRTRFSFFLPISSDYSFFLGLGLTWEFRYIVQRWIGNLLIPVTAGFRYRL
jgi:hypothetical protein